MRAATTENPRDRGIWPEFVRSHRQRRGPRALGRFRLGVRTPRLPHLGTAPDDAGVTPWRLPSIVWAILCGIFQPFGIILELVAEFTTRPQPHPSPTPGGSGPAGNQFAFGGSRTTAAETLAPIEIAPGPTSFGPALAPPPDDGSGKPALFGWYNDTTGRHALRYWDGRGWTEHVADDGKVSTDPV